MVKFCTRCSRTLDESQYNWKIKYRQLAAYCKECSRAYVKEHYNRNTSYYIKKATIRNFAVRTKLQQHIGSFLSSHPCVDCGETDIVVLEFDHKDRNKKFKDISKLVRSMQSVKALTSEMAKCEVRCANCHRRKTAKEDNSWKVQYSKMRP